MQSINSEITRKNFVLPATIGDVYEQYENVRKVDENVKDLKTVVDGLVIGENFTPITKSDLATLKNNSELLYPHYYKILDWSAIESLIVSSIDVNKIHVTAKSVDFPQDIIEVDTSDADSANWFISYRRDTVKELSSYEDWRTKTFERNEYTYNFPEITKPWTSITIVQDGNPISVSGTSVNGIVDLISLIQKTLGISDIVFGSGNVVIQNLLTKKVYGDITFTDGDSNPQTITPTETVKNFYTFGNDVIFSTNTFTPSADGNGGNCKNITVGGCNFDVVNTTINEIIFGNCFDIIIGEESYSAVIGDGWGLNIGKFCSGFIIKNGCTYSYFEQSNGGFVIEENCSYLRIKGGIGNFSINESNKRIESGFSNFEETLNISNRPIFAIETNNGTLTIPSEKKYAGVITLLADLYDVGKSYLTNEVVVSDGTNGGVAGKIYVSLADANVGNLLSDTDFWKYADWAEDNAGRILITNIISLTSNNSVKLKPVSGNQLKFKASNIDTATANNIVTLDGIDVIVTGRDTISDEFEVVLDNSINKEIN